MTEETLFFSMDLTPEAFAGEIAKVLRSGSASEVFLRRLADLFDPQAGRSMFTVKLTRTRRSRPPKPFPHHNMSLGLAMIEAMNSRGDEKSTEVARRLAKQHGVSIRTAYGAMKIEKALEKEWIELQRTGHY